jgi:hypothetical protein
MKRAIIFGMMAFMVLMLSMSVSAATLFSEDFESGTANFTGTTGVVVSGSGVIDGSYSYTWGASDVGDSGVIGTSANYGTPTDDVTLSTLVKIGAEAYGEQMGIGFTSAGSILELTSGCGDCLGFEFSNGYSIRTHLGSSFSSLYTATPDTVYLLSLTRYTNDTFLWEVYDETGTTLLASASDSAVGMPTPYSTLKIWGVDPMMDMNLIVRYDNIVVSEVDSCVADWVCSGYANATCLVNDTSTAACNAVTDNNTCGDSYSGDYSEFDNQTGVCDYCTPSWNCTGFEACVSPATTASCNETEDLNGCFATTSLAADQYSGNYSEFNTSACTYPSSGGGTRYVVDADGNLVGVQSGGAVQMTAPVAEEKGTFLSLTGGQNFDFVGWLKGLWTTMKGWFVQ